MDYPVSYKYRKGGIEEIYPDHPMVSNWIFDKDEESEALLCHYMAEVAEKNGLTANDLQHLFPAVMRMLRSDIQWSGQKEK